MRKLTQDQVQSFVESKGFKLLSLYRLEALPILLECPKGHQIEKKYNAFRRSPACYVCQNRPSVGATRLDTGFVRAQLELEGYTLLSEYVNANTHIQIKCPEGHEYGVKYNNFKQGKRCPECDDRSRRIPFNELIELYAAEGFTLLAAESDYTSMRDKLPVKCPEGHVRKQKVLSFVQGARCAKCSDNAPLTPDEKADRKLKQYVAKVIGRYATGEVNFSKTALAWGIVPEIKEVYANVPAGHHVDHIVPKSYFNHNNPEEIKACWHPNNLRYLPGLENIGRNNRMTRTEVQNLTQEQLNILLTASRVPERVKAWIK